MAQVHVANAVPLNLAASKTNQLERGTNVVIGPTNDSTFPVAGLAAFMANI